MRFTLFLFFNIRLSVCLQFETGSNQAYAQLVVRQFVQVGTRGG